MSKLDLSQLSEFVDQWWDDSALPSLCEFVEIPALSPSFDSDWEANGYLDAAVNTFVAEESSKNNNPCLYWIDPCYPDHCHWPKYR